MSIALLIQWFVCLEKQASTKRRGNFFFQKLKFLSIKNQFDVLIVPHVGKWHFLFHVSGCLFRVLSTSILYGVLFRRCSRLGNQLHEEFSFRSIL